MRSRLIVGGRRFLERGGGWVAAQFVLLAAVFLLAIRYPGEGAFAWRVAGALALLLAAGVAIAGAVALGRNLTPFPEPGDRSHLVTRGIYARIRHPLYTSVVLAGAGWALLWLSWPAGAVALVLVPFFHAKSRREERVLHERFPGYRDYERSTHRFVPGIY